MGQTRRKPKPISPEERTRILQGAATVLRLAEVERGNHAAYAIPWSLSRDPSEIYDDAYNRSWIPGGWRGPVITHPGGAVGPSRVPDKPNPDNPPFHYLLTIPPGKVTLFQASSLLQYRTQGMRILTELGHEGGSRFRYNWRGKPTGLNPNFGRALGMTTDTGRLEGNRYIPGKPRVPDTREFNEQYTDLIHNLLPKPSQQRELNEFLLEQLGHAIEANAPKPPRLGKPVDPTVGQISQVIGQETSTLNTVEEQQEQITPSSHQLSQEQDVPK